ncbi:restriction alleviation protein, Lar family [Billgrantia azerbaijanica]|nr:restriction alleviation protein, Lar family [Halomonas azerbaijanica]
MSELKPCPFCGGKPARQELEDGGQVIECSSCLASTPIHYDRCENLVSSWNRRSLPEGMALVPRSITAETGHKAGMIGDFHETITLECRHCEGEGCEECHGTGQHRRNIPVSWTTIKAIHRRIVELSEAHQDKEVQPS